jgi:hypothetical protein
MSPPARRLPAMAYTRQVPGKRSPPEQWQATTGAASLLTDVSAREPVEGTSLYFRISLFQFLISSFRLGGRYLMWKTASLKVPRCCIIFFCSMMMD